jgi:hypothetical protein
LRHTKCKSLEQKSTENLNKEHTHLAIREKNVDIRDSVLPSPRRQRLLVVVALERLGSEAAWSRPQHTKVVHYIGRHYRDARDATEGLSVLNNVPSLGRAPVGKQRLRRQ